MDHAYERRLVLAVQVHGYAGRTVRMQSLIREGLRGTLDEAAARARLDRGSWQATRGEEGEIAVLPSGTPEALVADQFVQQVHTALREHNRLVAADGRLRLRLAIHFGMVGGTPESGFDGPAVVVARDLAGCAHVRDVLDGGDAELVVIVSRTVFDDTIAGQLTSLEADDLRRVEAGGREAWLRVLGGSAPPPLPSPGPEAPSPPSPGPEATPYGPGTFAGAHIDARGGHLAGRDMTVHHHGEKS